MFPSLDLSREIYAHCGSLSNRMARVRYQKAYLNLPSSNGPFAGVLLSEQQPYLLLMHLATFLRALQPGFFV